MTISSARQAVWIIQGRKTNKAVLYYQAGDVRPEIVQEEEETTTTTTKTTMTTTTAITRTKMNSLD